MGTITAKQLKQKTGEIIKRVKSGEQLTLTYRGKVVATIIPSADKDNKDLEGLTSFEKAWKGIEESLENTKPAFKGWKEATEWIRSRSRS